MKQVKFILWTIYVSLYTSLIWSVAIFWDLKVGPNEIRVLFWIACIFTGGNIGAIIGYLHDNWDKE